MIALIVAAVNLVSIAVGIIVVVVGVGAGLRCLWRSTR